MRADGKLHNLTIHLNIKYNGTPDACSSLSASREFIYDKLVAASIKYYVPRKFKHLPLEVTRCMRIPEKCRRTVFWEWGLQENSLWILSKPEYISDPNFVFPCRILNLNKSINPGTKGLKKTYSLESNRPLYTVATMREFPFWYWLVLIYLLYLIYSIPYYILCSIFNCFALLSALNNLSNFPSFAVSYQVKISVWSLCYGLILPLLWIFIFLCFSVW